ncbi:hypothetical protein CROQUDRAFT_452455 [Cronartium quercuum f. sp. fusiforme G11]|uniref:Uncharacterized protein n=1 Tax=Cronartium quercuum f. sp. fusiforme G11 TaxID=708437 RepID=A0A9P6NIV3_9BASI|nr:hypothetical protein CROQUDRAFT_452455 [Cronartium quercuum f. sp. fusiforme G11]
MKKASIHYTAHPHQHTCSTSPAPITFPLSGRDVLLLPRLYLLLYTYTFVLPLHRLLVRQPPKFVLRIASVVSSTDPEVSFLYSQVAAYNPDTWRRRDIHAAAPRVFQPSHSERVIARP